MLDYSCVLLVFTIDVYFWSLLSILTIEVHCRFLPRLFTIDIYYRCISILIIDACCRCLSMLVIDIYLFLLCLLAFVIYYRYLPIDIYYRCLLSIIIIDVYYHCSISIWIVDVFYQCLLWIFTYWYLSSIFLNRSLFWIICCVYSVIIQGRVSQSRCARRASSSCPLASRSWLDNDENDAHPLNGRFASQSKAN